MSAVLEPGTATPLPLVRSEGVWHAAWRRFRADRVGMVSLAIVLAFLVLIVLSALGAVARGWQDEVGVPNARPTFVGAAEETAATVIGSPKGPNVDLSAIEAPQ